MDSFHDIDAHDKRLFGDLIDFFGFVYNSSEVLLGMVSDVV